MSLEQQLQQKNRSEPEKMPHYLELAQFYVNEDRYRRGRETVGQGLRLSEGDNDIREKWEDSQLRSLRQKIAHTKDPEAKKRLQAEYFEKDMLFYKARVERYPEQPQLQVRVRLPLHENQTVCRGNPGAADREERSPPPGACMLVLGQCFQQIQQFPLAKKHYEAAIQEIPEHDPDNKKRALYLAGRLTLGMRDLDAAEKHLSALAAWISPTKMSPSY